MKIITAINNPKLNDELKNEKNIEIICKDIFYKCLLHTGQSWKPHHHLILHFEVSS